MKVSITNPKDSYKPGDVFEGEITLRNTDKDRKGNPKKAKMKFVEITFAERIPLQENALGTWQVFLDGSRDSFKGKVLGKSHQLPEWKNLEFKDSEPVSKPFSITIPGGWHSNLGGQQPNKDWFINVTIREKTGLMGTPRYSRIMPVENSDRIATILDEL